MSIFSKNSVKIILKHYLGADIENELTKKRADARLGRHLHSLRPAYARLGMGLDQAASSADTRINDIKAKLVSYLSGCNNANRLNN